MSYIEELKTQFPTQTAFQLALYAYVYNKDYKRDLELLKESLNGRFTDIHKKSS